MHKTTEKTALTSENAENLALDVFKAGGLVALPTETVYGLAADATNGEAVASIYEAKGRPSFNPLIVHCDSLEMAMQYGEFSNEALNCAKHFWPGPLTLVVPYKKGAGLSDLVRAGLDTVAIRVPMGKARHIIGAYGKPIAAPSANLSGKISPTSADHVATQLDGRIDLILDGGPASVGLESTIVSFVEGKTVLLRPGGLSTETLEEHIGAPLHHSTPDGHIKAPGMMLSHYAPNATLRLSATEIDGEDGALTFGAAKLDAHHVLSLSESGDLKEAAANLFSCLTQFDELGVKRIAVSPIPTSGLGLAINDRLARAAAPR
ncbi:MAG: L-threonylcarbamoyladenylate synthase [Hyphomicrobiales bacterium]